MDTNLSSNEIVPGAILSSILQEYLGTPQVHLKKGIVSLFSNSGVSGNNSFYRADVEWITSSPMSPTEYASWLIKRWTPGGLNQSELGWSRPVEALAWQHGILHPETLPPGVKTPIVGSVIDPSGEIAWVAMTDVSTDLRRYDRSAPQPTERLIANAKMILAGLARFHALWEQPDRHRFLETMDWLLPLGNYLWRNSAFYAAALNKDVLGGFSQETSIEQEDVLNLQVFLDWLEPAEQTLLKEILVDRSWLVDQFSDLPSTLLHGDLDDRNIGLSGSSLENGEVVLIDWERMGNGPAALDVAKFLIHTSMMGEPGNPLPDACVSEELLDYYYENYRLAGGRQLDHATWRHSYDLALIAQSVWPFPAFMGNILRALRGEAPLPEIPGLPTEGLKLLFSSSLEAGKHTTDLILNVLKRLLV